MWELRICDDLSKRLKKFTTRYRPETANALAHLQEYLDALNNGLIPQKIIRGWVHSEPKGVKAFDQSGPGNPRKAIRLYVYPDESQSILYAMTIGDKTTQQNDIKHCEYFVDQIVIQSHQLTLHKNKKNNDE